jgi:hypothetical protein
MLWIWGLNRSLVKAAKSKAAPEQSGVVLFLDRAVPAAPFLKEWRGLPIGKRGFPRFG